MPLHEFVDNPKLHEYTKKDLNNLQHDLGTAVLGITEEHMTWVEPIWRIAAAAVDNQPTALYAQVEPGDNFEARQIVYRRTLEALKILVFGIDGEGQPTAA